MYKNASIKYVYLAITILITAFIFYNSFQSGEISSNTSNKVLDIINNSLSAIGLNLQFTGIFVRKSAHFIEFFVFGVFLMLTINEFYDKTIEILERPLFIGLFVPVIDEYIQSFSPDRVSAVSDVLLDFFGAGTGILLVCIVIAIKDNYNRNNKYKKGFLY